MIQHANKALAYAKVRATSAWLRHLQHFLWPSRCVECELFVFGIKS